MRTQAVVCAVNETQGAAEALRTAADLCARLEMRLVAANVVEDVQVSADARREARAGGMRMVDRLLLDQGILLADARVAVGDPAEEIARIASEERAELIIVGSEPNGLQSRPPLRSPVSTELIHLTSIPVVVVPPGAAMPNPHAASSNTESAWPEPIAAYLDGVASKTTRPRLALEQPFQARLVLIPRTPTTHRRARKTVPHP